MRRSSIRKLREADRLLDEGQEVSVVAKQLEVSEQTLHRWRLQNGGRKAEDAKRLNELEKENSRLKQIVADQLLENQAPLKESRPRAAHLGATGERTRPHST
jgi:putative transposase